MTTDTESEFIDDLIVSYPTLKEMAEELSMRIDETLDLRKQLEAEKEKRAPRALASRIKELERDLATVNARVAATGDAEMMLRKLTHAHKNGHQIPDEWWPTIERIAVRNASPLRTEALSQGHSESFGSEPFTPCGDCPTPLSCGNSGCAVQLVERAIKEDCLCPSWVVSCSKADCQRKQQSAEGHSQGSGQ